MALEVGAIQGPALFDVFSFATARLLGRWIGSRSLTRRGRAGFAKRQSATIRYPIGSRTGKRHETVMGHCWHRSEAGHAEPGFIGSRTTVKGWAGRFSYRAGLCTMSRTLPRPKSDG